MIAKGKKITGYESVRLSDSSSVTKSDSIDENHRAYVNFVSSLKSPITRKAYVIRLKNYLRSPVVSFFNFDELLRRDVRVIEQEIIDILIDMRHQKQLSYSSQNGFLAAKYQYIEYYRKRMEELEFVQRTLLKVLMEEK